VSSAFRGQTESAPDPGTGRTPVVSVSRSALRHNADAAAAAGISTYPASLLRADAWGHGEALVREVLNSAGLIPASAGIDPLPLFGLTTASMPVMRFAGTVLATKDLRAGEGVSYGYRYRAPADTRVALVTGGYAQGVVRSLGGAASVTFAGTRHPVVGRVAMDVCVVEIADAEVHRGDEATFFGDPRRGEPSIREWCTFTGMTAGELVSAVGLHANRVVTE
jgi:alanine racemase